MKFKQHEPDAECIICGKMYFSAEGHKDYPICKDCLKNKRSKKYAPLQSI